jgi:hypothetical protein
MKKKLFFKFFVFAVIAVFVTITSCKDYDDDISRLDTDLSALKSSTLAQSDLSALKTQLDASIASVQTDLNAAKTNLATLQTAAATKADIDAAKAAVLEQAVKLETLTEYQTLVEGELATLETDLAKAATKEQVETIQTLLASDVDELRDELGAKIANLEAILKVVDGESEAIADILSQLEEQLASIEANKDEIEATKADLQAKYDGLTADINALKGRTDTLEEGLAALESKVDAIKVELDGKIAALTSQISGFSALLVDIYGNLDTRVTSLTFIPDFTSYDGTPQMAVHFLGEWYKPNANVQNWDPNYEYEEALTPYKGITYAKFHVSPSNATLDNFEVVGLLHKTSEILFRSTDEPLLKAVVEDATLKNGILTVPILVHADLYDMDDFGSSQAVRSSDNDEELLYALYDKNISVALQVKNKNLDEGDDTERLVVSTEYVRTQLSLLFARIEVIDDEGELGRWANRLPSFMRDNIALATYNRPEIELWNGWNADNLTYDRDFSINLNEYVQAIAEFNYTWRLLEAFGYDNIEDHFVFELVDLPNEGVDQSNRYVTLNGETGVIKVNPTATGGANTAAKGRTPVVLAKVVLDGKVYAAGYLKIVITDKKDDSPVKFDFEIDDFVLNCGENYEFTENNEQVADLDQLFNHPRIALSKDAFFNEYLGGPIFIDWANSTYPTGATSSMFFFATNTWYTQTGLLGNYISGWISNIAPKGNYKIRTTLSSITGNRPDIYIDWTFEVKLPSYSLTPNTAILSGGKIVVNPTILEQNGKTSAAYEALLNNAFMHSAFNFTYTPLPPACDEALTPYFVFASDPSGYERSDDLTKLYTFGHKGDANYLAAVIETDPQDARKYFVRLNNDDLNYPGESWNNYTPLSEASKGLVGKTVSVQPRGYINGAAAYNWINLYTAFNVEFTYPLELLLPGDAAVYDQANNGLNVYAFNPYDPTTALIDWNDAELNITTPEGRALINHYEVGTQPVPGTQIVIDWTFAGYFFYPGTVTRPGYQGWWWAPVTAPTVTYSSPFVFDTDNAKCNIDGSGNIVSAITFDIPAGMKLKYGVVDAAGHTTIVVGGETINVPTTYAFEWENGATGAIQNAFKIAIPVSLTHKWGVLQGTLIITVNPGSGPAPEV